MAFGMNVFENPEYVEEPTAFSDEKSRAAKGWNELADQQRANAEMEEMNANRALFDGYIDIEQGAKRQKLALDHQRAIAGAAMIQSAFRNGGMSDRSLSESLSQAFGRPVFGGQLVKGVDLGDGHGPQTVLQIYGAAKDPRTGAGTIAPVAMLGSGEMVRLLKSAKLGDATDEMQNALIDNSYLGKWTDAQRAEAGVSRPSAPISLGTTVISGAGMRALRGQPRQRGSVSVYSTTGTDKTFLPDGTVIDRSVEQPARWRVLESGPDGMRYENDQTGEVVNVPKGGNLRDVLRGSSERERVAQIQAQGKADAAAIRAAGRGTAGAGAGAVKVDKDLIAAVKEMRAAYAPKMQNDDNEMVDNPNADPEMFRRYSDRLNQLLLGGGEGTQGGVAGIDAKRQELIRRGLLNPDGTPKRPAADNGGQQSGTAQQQGTTTQQSTQKRDGAPKESYDTKLTPDEESQYQEWRKTLPEPLQSEEDYDLRGYWKDPDTQKDGIEDGQHFTDRYKKPNHPTFSNESMYATGEHRNRAGHWDENGKFVASDAQLSERENARIEEFTKGLGGTYESDDDGNVRIKIANWEYLPEDMKKRFPERSRGDLDDILLSVQREANARRKMFEKKFADNVLPGIEAEARKKFPNNAKRRNKYIDDETIKWRLKNDPAEKRRREDDDLKRGGMYFPG